MQRLLGSYDDGVWVAGIYAEIEGCLPSRPWRHGELSRVLGALTRLSADLTPASVAPAPWLRRALVGGGRWHRAPGPWRALPR
ncbi:hypothetical protein Ga0074812_102146 [Parafrankia irregularis]|uniref:Uncharacterized protein n=1 Tax=Parafrankia irregularis TaxID=795642 RepID=A0A0S4QFT6_9ACTN|nr:MULTISPECIES: hypothetical protein [Parafrankia]MBE3203214.1 hypothetical protein [Parafrankia sp. CH37]CUU54142.1 hypothetical protein Ga0074812_102146 [Parafrankia irregularis]